MKLVFNVEDKRQHIDLWLTLFQSGAGFTDREKSVLVELLVRRDKLSLDGITDPYLTKLLFDVESRKIYMKELGISTYTLTNVLTSLRGRGVIGEDNSIDPSLIPEDLLEIEFK